MGYFVVLSRLNHTCCRPNERIKTIYPDVETKRVSQNIRHVVPVRRRRRGHCYDSSSMSHMIMANFDCASRSSNFPKRPCKSEYLRLPARLRLHTAGPDQWAAISQPERGPPSGQYFRGGAAAFFLAFPPTLQHFPVVHQHFPVFHYSFPVFHHNFMEDDQGRGGVG